MKKLFALALAAVMALSMAACSSSSEEATDTSLQDVLDRGYITVAISPDFAPSEFKDPNTGEVLGVDPWVAQQIANYLGVELKIEEMDFKSCIAAVQAGNVDFSLNGYAKTEERAENFYCTSYYGKTESTADSYQGIMILAENYDKYHSAEDFATAGITIAVQNTSLQYNLVTAQLQDAFPDNNLTIEFIANLNQGANMVATGKVDAMACTSESGTIMAKNFDGLVMADFKFDYTSEGSIGIVNIDDVALGDAISAAIDEMSADPDVNWTQIRSDYTDLANELGVTNE